MQVSPGDIRRIRRSAPFDDFCVADWRLL